MDREALGELSVELETWLPLTTSAYRRDDYQKTKQFKRLGKAIRLEGVTALNLFRSMLTPNISIDHKRFKHELLAANNVWFLQDESLFQEFASKLEATFLNNLETE